MLQLRPSGEKNPTKQTNEKTTENPPEGSKTSEAEVIRGDPPAKLGKQIYWLFSLLWTCKSSQAGTFSISVITVNTGGMGSSSWLLGCEIWGPIYAAGLMHYLY